jgi:hypothetical protein
MLKALPNRNKLRIDVEEPKSTKFKTLRLDPILAIPYTLRLELQRENDRMEIEDPNRMKSKTLKELPNFVIPHTDNAWSLVKLRMLIEEPRLKMSMTDKLDPNVVKP